ncbi:hypothetical protein [Filifactor villosus]|uniref:Uncharacterized protein n=1 Tax=Filifactor villosus TaxID=29374 RepID=A0ABV9QP28_9FIRM
MRLPILASSKTDYIILVLFFLIVLQAMVILFSFIIRKRKLRILSEVVFTFFLFILYYFYASLKTGWSIGGINSSIWRLERSEDYMFLMTLLFFCVIRAIFLIYRYFRCTKEKISVFSLKEAVDNLSEGIIFSKPNGFVILSNLTAEDLSLKLTGAPLKNANIFLDTVMGDRTEMKKDVGESTWIFESRFLSEGQKVLCQTTCRDITMPEQLIRELEKKIKEQEKMHKEQIDLLDALTEVQKQEALLQLRLETHAKLGLKVSVMDYILNSEMTLQKKVEMIQENFSEGVKLREKSLSVRVSNLIRSFKELGLNIEIEGMTPIDTVYEELWLGLIKEAAINAINHGKSANMRIKVTDKEDVREITIENDGEIANKNIKIGGGLTSINRNAEIMGGTMKIETDDKFVIKIYVDKKQMRSRWML